MIDLNSVTLIGRLTKDPEIKNIGDDKKVATLSIAVNRSSGGGETKKDEVSFFNVIAWNKLADICGQYLRKASKIGVTGRLRQRRWTTEAGENRSVVEIVAESVQFLDTKKDDRDASERAEDESDQDVVY